MNLDRIQSIMRAASLAPTVLEPNDVLELGAFAMRCVEDRPEPRHTQLGVLPVNVTTIDMLDHALSLAQERDHQRREELVAMRDQLRAEQDRHARVSPLAVERAKRIAKQLVEFAELLDVDSVPGDEYRAPSLDLEAERSRIVHQAADETARQLDELLAPLVANGGSLSRQYAGHGGTERYYVDGKLRLELGPIEQVVEGTHWRMSRKVKRFG